MRQDGVADASAFEISVCPQLIDDYLYVAEPIPPALGTAGDLVAIDDGVLAIDGSQLMHYEPDPLSQSGWRSSTIRVPRPPTAAGSGPIMQVKAFMVNGEKNDGTASASLLNVMCLFPAQGWEDGGGFAVSWIARERGGDWHDVPLTTVAAGFLSLVTQLEVFDAGAGAGLFVYGATPNLLQIDNALVFLLNLPDWLNVTTSKWSLAQQAPAASFDVPSQVAARYAFMTVGTTNTEREVVFCWWAGTSLNMAEAGPAPGLLNLQSPFATTNGIDVASLVPLQGMQFRFSAAIVDSGGAVWRAVFRPARGTPPDIECIPLTGSGGDPGPTGVVAVSIARRQDSVMLFAQAIETAWLLRGLTDANEFEHAPWVNLGNQVVAMAAPDRELQSLELFYADATPGQRNRIFHLSEDLLHSVWITTKLATFKAVTPNADKSAAPNNTSTVTIDVTVTHANRAAARNAPLSIGSDQWVALVIAGQSYWTGPGRDAVLQTDEVGKVLIRHEATSLTFPKLTFTTGSGGPTTQISCQGDVVETGEQSLSSVAHRLAGKDAKHATDGPALIQAGLIPSDSTDGAHIADMLNHTGTWLLTHTAKTGSAVAATEAIAARAWTIDIAADRTVSCREVEPDSLGASELGFSIGDFVGDVLHRVKHAIDEVKSWTVKIAEDGIHFALNGINYIVDTVRKAGDLVAAILCSIQKVITSVEDFVKKIVAFLKLLFEWWGDIKATHKAIKHVVTWAFSYATTRIDDIKSFADTGLTTLETKIASCLASAEAHFAGSSATPNSHVDALAKGKDVLAGHRYKQHLKHHGARCSYVLGLSKGHLGHLGTSTSGFGTGAIDGAVNGHWGDRSKVQTLNDSLSQFSIDDLFGQAIGTLLGIFKDIIQYSVDGAKYVIDLVLNLVVDAISEMINLLLYPPDIPLISFIYETFIGSKMTLLDVMCLILAVPTTILYKLALEADDVFDITSWWDVFESLFVLTDGKADLDFQSWADAGKTHGIDFLKGFVSAMPMLAGVLDLFSSSIAILADTIAILINAAQAYGEASATPTAVAISWINWVLAVAATVFAMPVGTFADFDDQSASDISQTVYYALEFLPLISDLISLMPTRLIQRMSSAAGPVAEGAAGFLILGAAITYVASSCVDDTSDSTPWDYVNAILTSVPRPFRALIALTQGADLPAVAAFTAVTLGGDLIGLLGGTATQIGSAIEG